VYDAVAAVFDRIDYVEAVDPETLEPVAGPSEQLLIAIAAHVGSTRLIDNLVLGQDARP
jgi:pantothenate synthetase